MVFKPFRIVYIVKNKDGERVRIGQKIPSDRTIPCIIEEVYVCKEETEEPELHVVVRASVDFTQLEVDRVTVKQDSKKKVKKK